MPGVASGPGPPGYAQGEVTDADANQQKAQGRDSQALPGRARQDAPG